MPCDSCPRAAKGLPMPCRGESHARFCALAAEGHEGYIALLCGETKPIDPRAAVLARRAGKLRLKLGEKAPTPSPGRR